VCTGFHVALHAGETQPSPGLPASTGALRVDAEIAASTFVDLDFIRFPKLPPNEVPSAGAIFVSTDGDDTGAGTQASPFLTMTHAIHTAAAGSTIVVRAGDYPEQWESEDYRALVLEKDGLTLMAWPGESVRMRPAPGVSHGMVVNAQNLVIRGINVDGFGTIGILFTEGSKRNRHVVVADLEITGSEEAIAMWDPASSVDELLLANVKTDAIIHCGSGPCSSWRLENVTIDASGEGWGADAFAIESGDNFLLVNTTVLGAGSDGIDTKATRVVVLDSRVEGVQNNAVKLWYGGDVINTTILRGWQNPVVVEKGRFRLLNSAIGFTPQFAGHRDYSMICGYDKRQPMQIEIVNSIIANASGAMWINPESSTVSIRNSLFFTADGSEILIHGDFTAGYGDGIVQIDQRYGAGNLAADPMLDGELRPAASSPAIDAGIALAIDFPKRDREGGARVRGTAPDLGAFEGPAASLPVEKEPTTPAAPGNAGQPTPSPAPALPTAGVTMTENFETPPDPSWELLGPAVKVESGKLTCSAPGHAAWLKTQMQNFTLTFAYQHGVGAGDVVLRGSGEPPQNQEYRVRLSDKVQILRRVGKQEMPIASMQYQFTGGQTYTVTIKADGGQLQVEVDGQPVVTYSDPQPLPAGVMAFGCVEGSGFAYDDITVSPSGEAAIPKTIPEKFTPPEVAGSPVNGLSGLQILRELEYSAYEFDGKKHRLMLDLYLPEQSVPRPLPVLVYMHGGGWFEGNKSLCPGSTFAKNGYATACISYRLARRVGNTCPSEFIFPSQIHDVKSAIRWLRENAGNYGLDSNRFGLIGASSGASLAVIAGVSNGVPELEGTKNNKISDRVQAVADWHGVVKMEPGASLEANPCQTNISLLGPDGKESPERYRAAAIALFLGGLPTDPMVKSRAQKASPLAYLDSSDPPVLVIHGEEDPYISIEESQVLVTALQKTGIPVTFVPLPAGGHGYGGALPPGVDNPDDPVHAQHVHPKYLKPTLKFFSENIGR
jgi:acetyl esterase/lipase